MWLFESMAKHEGSYDLPVIDVELLGCGSVRRSESSKNTDAKITVLSLALYIRFDFVI